MLIDEMLWTIGIGWVVIILTTVLLRALYQRER
jgi:hypothetical protein